MTRTIYIEDILDRDVVDRTGRRLGRIHEIVAEKHNGEYRVSEYRLGSGALLDRFPLTRWLFRRMPKALVVAADKLVITHGSAPCIADCNGTAAD